MTQVAIKVQTGLSPVLTEKEAAKVKNRKNVTRTYLSESWAKREADLLGTEPGRFLQTQLTPNELADVKACLKKGTLGPEAVRLRERFFELSWINQAVRANPFGPGPFPILYLKEDPPTEFDRIYPMFIGAKGIRSRHEAIVSQYPQIIDAERKRQGLRKNQLLRIDDFGCGQMHYLIDMFDERPDLKKKVHIRGVDTDKEALDEALKVIKRKGLEGNFHLVPKSVTQVRARGAHIISFIGMECGSPDKQAVKYTESLIPFSRVDGIVIISFVREAMLEKPGGALLDMLMELQLWNMCFKADGVPDQILESAGWTPEPELSFLEKDECNLMAVGRLPASSFDFSAKLKRGAQNTRCNVIDFSKIVAAGGKSIGKHLLSLFL